MWTRWHMPLCSRHLPGLQQLPVGFDIRFCGRKNISIHLRQVQRWNLSSLSRSSTKHARNRWWGVRILHRTVPEKQWRLLRLNSTSCILKQSNNSTIRDGPTIHSITKEKVKISDFHSDYKLKTMTRPSKWVNESCCQIQFQVSKTYPSDLTLKAKAVQQTRADSSKTFTAAIFSSTLSMKDSTKTALSNELTIFFLINDTK